MKIAVLSGSIHAEEVACELPSAIVAVSESLETAQLVQKFISNDYMRVYINVDIESVELCGALKNVVALAIGISDGIAMNCNETTFYGLTGIGDLIVTADKQAQ